MIPHDHDTALPVVPKVSLFGRPRPWNPEPVPARHVPLPVLARPQASRLEPYPGKVGEPRHYEVPRPARREARSVPIGRFGAPGSRIGTPPGAPGCGSGSEVRAGVGTAGASTLDPDVRLAAVLQPPLERLLHPAGLEWPAPLMPFQRDGVAVLLSRREVLLADDMGLGKTIQAAAAMRVLSHRGEIARALVACPASLLTQWQRELSRWAPELRVEVVRGNPSLRGALWRVPAHVRLVSYDTLRGDVLDLKDSPVLRETWDLVILDEAQRIKNRDTGVALACKRIPRKRRWALTGTPLENRIEDLQSILEFLIGDRERRVLPRADRDRLRELLCELQLRRKKEDVLHDLPPKVVLDVPLELGAAQRAAYDRAEREGVIRLSQAGRTAAVTHVLELITRLKQLCNADPLSGESAKLEDIRYRIEALEAEGHRALVFSQFTDEEYGVARVCRHLCKFQPLSMTGAMSSVARTAAVDAFVRDPRHRVLVLSLRAGGVGLNLQVASYVFHLDRWWNPATEDQAESRAHRFGQRCPVTVYRYTCIGTIEERIARKLEEKRALFRELVDDASMDLRAAFTEAELFGLFGLPPPQTRHGTISGSGETGE
jgi:SNF2 family DNA or RNA helicase